MELNGTRSRISKVKSGVPQGSKLASIFFIIYINNVMKLELKGKAQFYADDGSFIYEASTYHERIYNINENMQKIKKRFNENLLKMNIEKTNFMIITNHNNIPSFDDFPEIMFENKMIKRVDAINFLGLIIDENLS